MEYKHELVLPNDDVPFRIFEFEGSNGHYRVKKHWHKCIEIFSVVKGNVSFYINRKQFMLNPDDSILVNSNDIHSIDVECENRVIVLQIPCDIFKKYDENGFVHFKQIYDFKDEKLYELVKKMFDVYTAKEKGYEIEVLSYYYALLNHLLVTYQDHEEGLTMYDTDRLTRLAEVADYITENYTLELNQKEVAEMFGFSSSYLSKLFKKKANINYKAFVEEVRVVNAHREMMNTDHSLCDIAFNNGFPNNKSFIKAFKTHYGMTPSEYRKKTKNDNKSNNIVI